MICVHCGHNMLDGFKFCHRCGKLLNIVTAAPEISRSIPPEEVPVSPPEAAGDLIETDGDAFKETGPDAGLSAGRVFFIELLCYIPIVNFILLGILSASGDDSPMREYARGKLLAALTVFFVFLLIVLTIIFLLSLDIIEPIYLGRWRS